MKKEELHFYLICPKCYQQDHLDWNDFKELVLDEVLEKKYQVGPTRPYRMEGEYLCPYGCKIQMLLFALGTYDEVSEKNEEMFKKYFGKMPPDCCTLKLAGY